MGGLSGHMMHPHDNLNMTIGQFKDLCNKSVRGELAFTEKVDGFNIHVLKHNGQMRFARNGQDLVNNGFGFEDIDNRFSNDRVRSIYKRAWELFVNRLDLQDLPEFSVAHVTLNCEVVVEGQTNIMPYAYDMVIVHNTFMWEHHIGLQGKQNFVVRMVRPAVLKRSTNLKIDRPKYQAPQYLNQAYLDRFYNEIFGMYQLTDENTLRDYYRVQFVYIIQTRFPELLESPELIKALFNRFFKDGEQTNLREIRKMTTLDITPIIDRAKDFVYVTKHNLDQLVLHLGTIILDHTIGINALWSTVAAGKLAQDVIDAPVRDVRFAERWNACEGKVFGIEGVVCEYDGNIYKWTGPFAPINQLLGGNRK